jgi:hypothetical protein
VSCSFFFCNCWLCLTEDQTYFRGGNEFFKCGRCEYGMGYSCFCVGGYCCIPEWLKLYSLRASIKDYRGKLRDVEVIPVAQPAPSPAVSQHQMYGR